ncbi:MAG TPA: hypothetical protein VLF91_05315 [Candidatus Saccharimonadales bacterium]|nr:hypothetical protein [Candidatus Saccharimonadales bacterium]
MTILSQPTRIVPCADALGSDHLCGTHDAPVTASVAVSRGEDGSITLKLAGLLACDCQIDLLTAGPTTVEGVQNVVWNRELGELLADANPEGEFIATGKVTLEANASMDDVIVRLEALFGASLTGVYTIVATVETIDSLYEGIQKIDGIEWRAVVVDYPDERDYLLMLRYNDREVLHRVFDVENAFFIE